MWTVWTWANELAGSRSLFSPNLSYGLALQCCPLAKSRPPLWKQRKNLSTRHGKCSPYRSHPASDCLFSATAWSAFAVGTALVLYVYGKIKTPQVTLPTYWKSLAVASPPGRCGSALHAGRRSELDLVPNRLVLSDYWDWIWLSAISRPISVSDRHQQPCGTGRTGSHTRSRTATILLPRIGVGKTCKCGMAFAGWVWAHRRRSWKGGSDWG